MLYFVKLWHFKNAFWSNKKKYFLFKAIQMQLSWSQVSLFQGLLRKINSIVLKCIHVIYKKKGMTSVSQDLNSFYLR